MNSIYASVLVIENHPLMREALFAAIADEPGLKIAGQVESGEEVISMVTTTHSDAVLLAFKPDIILLDLDNPGLANLDTIKTLRKTLPDTAILVLTSNNIAELNQAVLIAGAQVVLSKAEPRDEIISALNSLRNFKVDKQKLYINRNLNQYSSESQALPADY
jgi:DNA-binding NarL/FixJ family response regulator